MSDPEEIQVSVVEDSVESAPDNQDETVRGKIPGCVKTLQSNWQPVLIAVLMVSFAIWMVSFCAVISILFSHRNKQQSVTEELQHMAEELFNARNNTKQLQKENYQLKQLLNSTYQNFTILRNEYTQLKLVNATLHKVTLLSAEKTQMSHLLKNTVQEKAQLQVENKELNMHLNSTLEKCKLVELENRQLNMVLNKSMQVITKASADNERIRLLLKNEQQTSLQLQVKNQQQHSILSTERLAFIWRFCNKDTLQCLRCLPGWVEHASRCFFLSLMEKTWEDARYECLELGGDLAVVLNPEDQAFLTNMTFQFVQQHPQVKFHSAWIGLQDMARDSTHLWVNGKRVKPDVIYWKENEPNNALASWDSSITGQDCVAIVPPCEIGTEGWLNSWDDIVCGGKRHYLCETMAIVLS